MDNSHINIKFPFKDSDKGYYFDSNKTTSDAIKSDILHVLTTRKGERFYDPDFGTNLYQYLFAPEDNITLSDIKSEANSCLAYCMPTIQIVELTVEQSDLAILLKIIANDSDDIYINNIQIEVQL
jgi:phage baseplate assembly protein W